MVPTYLKTQEERTTKVVTEEIRDKFKDYKFRINWNSSEPYDPEKEAIDVRIKTKGEDEYSANFTTLKFLEYMFEKNRRTGECANGIYFCMPNLVVVKKLTRDIIKTTIDSLIDELTIECYFSKLED